MLGRRIIPKAGRPFSFALPSALTMAVAAALVGCLLAVYAVAQGVAAPAATSDDWPTHLHDNHRSGIASTSLTPPLSLKWKFEPSAKPHPAWPDPHPTPVEGIIDPPRLRFDDVYHVVAAEGMVYFGTWDNKVYCLDAATGRERWKVFTDGPVRLAPSLAGGRVYVGADDGRVYCISASDGKIVWQRSIAPDDTRVIGSGKIISMWPIRTGVAVQDNTLYCAAGVFPGERIYVSALNADDGSPVWTNDTLSDRNANRFGFSPQGYLLVDAKYLFIPSGRAMPACFDRATGKLLWQRGFSWRSVGVIGGTYALISGGHLYSGTERQIVTLDESKGSIGFAWFKGKRLVLTPAVAYMLGSDGVTALDRVRYPELSRRKRDLARRRQSLIRSKPKNLQEQLDKLRQEQEQVDKALQQCTKWRFERKNLDSLILAGNLVITGGKGEVFALDKNTGKQVWQAPVEGLARGLAAAEGRLFVSTDTGAIYCFASGAAASATVGPKPQPIPRDSRTPLFEQAAEAIVRESGVKRGFCLVLGSPTGRLAYELAKRTELSIYCVEPDKRKAQAARQALDRAGVYGSRVTVDCARYNAIPYPDYFANLIVSEEVLLSGRLTAPATVLRMLKPCGGVVMIGEPQGAGRLNASRLRQWLKASGVEGRPEVIRRNGTWVKLVRGALEGAGSWTHQYGEPGNTASSTDRLVKCPLGVLWYGAPGPGKVPSRHARNVAPLSINGRVYLQGINRIMCFDAYNGLMYWEREIKGAYRVGASHNASNIACDADSIFVAVGTKCLRLDGRTGQTLATFDVPADKDGTKRNWAWVAVVDGILYGSATVKSQFSNKVFAYDVETGKLRWVHEGKSIRDNTIAISDGMVFFADDRATEAERKTAIEETIARLIAEKKLSREEAEKQTARADVRIAVALDAKTGKVRWQRPVDLTNCGGRLLIAMAHNGVVVFSGAFGDGHFWRQFLGGEYAKRRVVALSAKDGSLLWTKAVGCRIRPLILGDWLIAEPWAFNLYTGEQIMRTHPITGRKTIWEFERPGHHCGAISACPNALFFRSWSYGYYDLARDDGTRHFDAIRPGCWINMLPANGLLIVPEASSGCVCSHAIQCTVVFKPRKVDRAWGLYCSRGDMFPVKRLGLNIGAPGDRADEKGRLWLSYPRPWGRMRMDVKLSVTILPKGGYFERPVEYFRIAGTDTPWLFASGCAGLTSCVIPVAREEDGEALYTVRLGFAEPGEAKPGQRVFDIKLQDRVVQPNFDIAAAAGAPRRAVVREFRSVKAAQELKIELVPKTKNPQPDQAPLLNWVELVRERVLSVGMAVPAVLLNDLADRQKTVEVRMANRTDRDFVGTLQIQAPQMFRIATDPARIHLATDSTATAKLTATVVQPGKAGTYEARVRLVREDGTVEVEREMTIEYLAKRARLVIHPSEDAHVVHSASTQNYRAATTLAVDGGDAKMGDRSHSITYIKFPLKVPGKPVLVKLRIRVNTSAGAESWDAGHVCLVTARWSEKTLTYDSRPKPGREIAKIGKVTRGEWVERVLDVDLQGMRELSIALEPTSCDGTAFFSRESSYRPELVVEYLPEQ